MRNTHLRTKNMANKTEKGRKFRNVHCRTWNMARKQWTFLNFLPFSVFLAIFHVLKCVFLIFRDFQVSRHITGPSVCISHFSCILVISSFSSRQVDVSHFPDFQFSCCIPRPTVDISKFSTFFSFPRHISRPKVCISHFP